MSLESDYMPYESVSRMGPGRVMVFAPHPDDEIFGCGGALIQHVQDQDPIQVVVVTDGALGGGLENLAEIRASESESAARLLGYPPPIFLGYPDRGLMPDDEALIQRFCSLISDFRADIVYVPSFWEIHPDHRVVSHAVINALRLMEQPDGCFLYEVGVPLRPNHLLDITLHQGGKWRAMGCFESQLQMQDYRRHIEALNVYRSYTLGGDCRLAEAYRWVQVVR